MAPGSISSLPFLRVVSRMLVRPAVPSQHILGPSLPKTSRKATRVKKIEEFTAVPVNAGAYRQKRN